MSELMTKSLAQIVTTNHRAASVFEKYHIDFCCKGKRSLEQACAENDLEVDKVVAELEKNTSGNSCGIVINSDRLSLAQLADHIVNTHHSYVKKEMGPILGYLQKIVSKHGTRHPEMIKVLEIFTAIKEEMEQHMEKEEKILFPRIKEAEQLWAEDKQIMIDSNYVGLPVTMMEQEHEHAGRLLAEIRTLTNDYNPPADAFTTYRLSFAELEAFETDLHNHVHLENNILFPKALKLFVIAGECSLN